MIFLFFILFIQNVLVLTDVSKNPVYLGKLQSNGKDCCIELCQSSCSGVCNKCGYLQFICNSVCNSTLCVFYCKQLYSLCENKCNKTCIVDTALRIRKC
ncbi:hypothetical protein Mgra_00004148 [Meloidogyne graminicola]|uniref:Uncharacterized protein n=1 Tax=Meloidogyne graminicola TaxID=189291 RepID=A0A8S9ZT66_9BILA|nr:hypothetical protein Mgra_00004148 [Meloidogyne graminicola]